MNRTSASSVFGVFVPHESEERVFRASVGLRLPCHDGVGSLLPSTVAEGGSEPGSPLKGLDRGDARWPCPSSAGTPGQSRGGAVHPSCLSCCAPSGTPAQAQPPHHDFFVVGRCLSKIHTAMV